jgi:predicted DsbA family dithiol-disulfide isomerase
VRLAHAFAFENENITSDMVEATEFSYLANKYQVYGVPKTVVNEKIYIEGAVPEPKFVDEALKALEK